VRLIPVLDVMNGAAVRAVAGRRSEYRPLVSRLVASAEPGAVARALVDTVRPAELYLADLDAIGGAAPNVALYASLGTLGVARWIDAGLRDADDAGPLLDAGVEGVVAGLETLRGTEALAALVRYSGPERVVFSLDLRDGVPLGGGSWPADADAVADIAVAAGVRRAIALDLARVGGGGGTGTEGLCRRLAARHPGVEWVAGGGVAGPDDLQRLADAGASAVLVASALHDGWLSVP
jgi:phosphoribosylformimino-5-aminoimidazole carboxamide ribotide isomerase